MAKAIPDGFRTVTPHIIVGDGAAALDFYQKAFGAEEICRMPGPDGSIMHAEISIGDSRIMLASEYPDMGIRSPKSIGGSPVTIHLYVNDCDAAMKRAQQAGAKVTMPCADMFWGDRYGKLEDPFGHIWAVATHKEDLTPDQIGERAAEAFGNC